MKEGRWGGFEARWGLMGNQDRQIFWIFSLPVFLSAPQKCSFSKTSLPCLTIHPVPWGPSSSTDQLFVKHKNKSVCWIILHGQCDLLAFCWTDFWNQKCVALSARIIDWVHGVRGGCMVTTECLLLLSAPVQCLWVKCAQCLHCICFLLCAAALEKTVNT